MGDELDLAAIRERAEGIEFPGHDYPAWPAEVGRLLSDAEELAAMEARGETL